MGLGLCWCGLGMNGRRGCSTVWPFDTVVGGCVLTPLYVLGSLFSVWFSRCFWGLGLFSGGFWVLFGTVLLEGFLLRACWVCCLLVFSVVCVMGFGGASVFALSALGLLACLRVIRCGSSRASSAGYK